jgi:cytochrome c556
MAVMMMVGPLAMTASAQAQGTDPEARRIEMMRALDKSGKALQAAARGEATIEVAKGKQWAKDVAVQFKDIAGLFPPGTNTSADTRASPKIWEEKAAFDKLMTDLIAKASAAEGLITDETSFKQQVAAVDDGCNACHRVYRTPRRR